MSRRAKVAILISGRGSNMEALIAASRSEDFPAEIAGVISNRAAAAGLETARSAGLATAVHSLKQHGDRESADAAMSATLEGWNVEIVCLAGFMRILTPGFVSHWLGRMINIHPSLLPKYKGLDTHERVLAAGDREHGCSVHFVLPELDAGPVIAQAHVPVLAGDNPETLTARVLIEEHKLYPMALKALAAGDVRLVQGEARWRDDAGASG